MIIYYLAETRDDGQTWILHTGLGYWKNQERAKEKAAKLSLDCGELGRFEVFSIFPYDAAEE